MKNRTQKADPWLSLRAAFCLLLCGFCVLLPAGCQQRMAEQPRYDPLEPSEFFPDGQSARPLVPGVVPRGHLREDAHFYTGKRDPQAASVRPAGSGPSRDVFQPPDATQLKEVYVDTFPFPVTKEVLSRGRERFKIYCAICHGPAGYGDGKIVERGFTPPPSYHIDRLRQAPVGYFFDVITSGYGAMPDHAGQVPPGDRWAIAAYIRALQLSQHAELNKLPPEDQARIPAPPASSSGGPP